MGLILHSLSAERAQGDLDGLPLDYETCGGAGQVRIAGQPVLVSALDEAPSVAGTRRAIYAAIARFRAGSKSFQAV